VRAVAPAASVPREGTRVRAANVRLVPLPYFEGPRQFYPRLQAVRRVLRAWVPTLDVLNCRVPTPAAWFAFKEARRAGVPVFLLVVGDLEAVAPTLPYRGVKRLLFAAYTAFEERAIRRMANASLTFANGAGLAEKHRRQGATVVETKTTTIATADINARPDTCQAVPIRLLTVSRIDPRKGLSCLPDAIRAAESGRPRRHARHRRSGGGADRRARARGDRAGGAFSRRRGSRHLHRPGSARSAHAAVS